MISVLDEMGAYLLVREKFYAGIRKYSYHGCGMPAKEAERTILKPDVPNSFGGACPGATVLLELRIRCLEENLDAIERCHHRLCLLSGLVTRHRLLVWGLQR